MGSEFGRYNRFDCNQFAMRYLLFIFLLAGCYGPKKAGKQAAKALQEHPEVVADKFRERFPCITTATDTLIEYRDTVIEVQDPQGYIIDTIIREGKTLRDTIYRNKTKRLPGIVKTVYVNQYIYDSVDLWQCQNLLEQSVGQNKELMDEVAKRDNKINGLKKWRKWLLWPYIIFVLFILIRQLIRNGFPAR